MPYQNQFWLFSLIALLCFAVHFSGEGIRELLIYQSSKVADGEVWRMLTCHFVHSNITHLVMNLAALVLLLMLLPIYQTVREGLLIVLSAGIMVGLLYLCLHTEELSYIGLSSILHSLAIIGGLKLLAHQRLFALGFIVIVCFKVVYENTLGESLEISQLIDARVAVESHLYGVIAGCAVALCLKYLNLFPAEEISV